MSTPEGKVKAQISALIGRYDGVYKFMPVPAGYGPSSLDYILCAGAHFIGIEAKAPGKSPTPRQMQCIKEIQQASGVVFIIDGALGLAKLECYLDSVCKRKTQNGGGALRGGGQEPVSERARPPAQGGQISDTPAPADRKLFAA